ncbi:hypothetical protein [Hyphomicrobium sp. DY-1]|uniref:hypothetical protein n=1 Tax=Hyphomicrobium sp. DY-1 TaxID=3075650 RepID=UPI0039C211E0
MEFDYDNIDEWAPVITQLLKDLLPANIAEIVRDAYPKYVEDARDLVLEHGDRNAIALVILGWLKSSTVAAYHGTRVTEEEAASIGREGFRPLKIADRRKRLERALSGHPEWEKAARRFDDVVTKFVNGYAGRREGQVHFTLSRAGLAGFDHYITHGAEVDQHMARELIGNDGLHLLENDGTRTVYKIGVPGDVAIQATHPFFSPEDMMDRGDLPNMVGEILNAWAFRLSRPGYQSRSLEIDCGLIFYKPVPPEYIISKEQL